MPAKRYPSFALTGVRADERELFHLAPHVAIKCRGLSEQCRSTAVQAALVSFVETDDAIDAPRDPFIVFTRSYLASHRGLDLLSEEQVREIMGEVERLARSAE